LIDSCLLEARGPAPPSSQRVPRASLSVVFVWPISPHTKRRAGRFSEQVVERLLDASVIVVVVCVTTKLSARERRVGVGRECAMTSLDPDGPKVTRSQRGGRLPSMGNRDVRRFPWPKHHSD
jgi:hypothetical protein